MVQSKDVPHLPKRIGAPWERSHGRDHLVSCGSDVLVPNAAHSRLERYSATLRDLLTQVGQAPPVQSLDDLLRRALDGAARMARVAHRRPAAEFRNASPNTRSAAVVSTRFIKPDTPTYGAQFIVEPSFDYGDADVHPPRQTKHRGHNRQDDERASDHFDRVTAWPRCLRQARRGTT